MLRSLTASGESHERANEPENMEISNTGVHAAVLHSTLNITLLATAQVVIIGPTGIKVQARALLDQSSEVSFIKVSIVFLLSFARRFDEITLTGIEATDVGLHENWSSPIFNPLLSLNLP